MKFKSVREYCLEKWLSGMNRKRIGLKDKFYNSLECQWQRKAGDLNYDHVSLFCSLGLFSTNVTDLLTDERFDDLSLDNPDHHQIIFRQYAKMGLVVSEILTDIKDTYSLATGKGGSVTKKKISKKDNTDAVNRIICFINHVFKHKCNGVHKCNHHTTLCFDDKGRDCCHGNILDISCADQKKCEEEIDTIIIPKMTEIIERVIQAYDKLDELFRDDEKAFKKICEKYSKTKLAA